MKASYLIGMLLGAAVALVTAPASEAQQGSNPSRGEELFVANGCYECHGYQGQGGEAPRIAPTPYPLQVFATLVRHPASVMPAYSPRALSDATLTEIYAYVSSRPEPVPVSEIPELAP